MVGKTPSTFLVALQKWLRANEPYRLADQPWRQHFHKNWPEVRGAPDAYGTQDFYLNYQDDVLRGIDPQQIQIVAKNHIK